jgi:hypothetical protein
VTYSCKLIVWCTWPMQDRIGLLVNESQYRILSDHWLVCRWRKRPMHTHCVVGCWLVLGIMCSPFKSSLWMMPVSWINCIVSLKNWLGQMVKSPSSNRSAVASSNERISISGRNGPLYLVCPWFVNNATVVECDDKQTDGLEIISLPHPFISPTRKCFKYFCFGCYPALCSLFIVF